jgi:hypothetical protein
MRSDLNLAVQLGVVAVCGLLRLLTPGWLLVIFFVFVPIGTAALVLQIVLAAAAVPRRRLTTDVSLAFGLLGASALGAALVIPDGGDGPSSVGSPLGLLLGHNEPEWGASVGMLLLVVWLGALIWTIVGLARTRPTPPPPPIYYGAWPGPAPVGLG